MKQFKIYKNPQGVIEAVKVGWSWPAFLVPAPIWCFVKKLYTLGCVILVIVIFATATIVGTLFMPIVWIWLGIGGNGYREKNLISRGYEFEDTIIAVNDEGAIAMYIKSNQNK
jgi:hypothetical protein